MNRNTILSGLLLLLLVLGFWFFQRSETSTPPQGLTGLRLGQGEQGLELAPGELPASLEGAASPPADERVAVRDTSSEAKRARKEKAEAIKAAPKGPWLSGLLLSVHGAPIPEAEVTIKGQADAGLVQIAAFSETITTDKRGEFKIPRGLWPALPLKIDAVATGHELFSGNAFPEKQRGDEFLGEFRLQPAVILGGVVVNDAGAPIAGATVWRSDPTEGRNVPEFMQMAQKKGRFGPGATETDEEGRFELPHEREGAYVIHAVHDHYPDAELEGVSPPAGTSELRLRVAFDPAASIEGRIVGMQGKRTGITVEAALQDAHGNTTNSPLISAMGMLGGSGHKAIPDGAGNFVLHGLPVGKRFQVQAFVKEGIMNKVACSEPQEASSGDTDVELPWRGGASLVFEVKDAATGKPISSGAVRYRWVDSKKNLMGNARKLQNFETSRVKIDELRPDPSPLTMELRVYAEGYLSEGREGLQVREFEHQDLGTILLQPSPKFRVQVLDSTDGKPIHRARVVLYPVNGDDEEAEFFSLGGKPSTGKTDREGWCELDVRASDLGKLTVRRRGYAAFDLEDLPMSKTADQTEVVRMLAGSEVTVYVMDSLGKPAPGIQVAHKSDEGPGGQRESDRNGQVRFNDLVAGEHSFRAMPRVRAPQRGGMRVRASARTDSTEELAWETTTVSPGGHGSVTLQLAATATLNGVVTRRGRPVAHAKVTFVDDPEITTSTDQRAELQERAAQFGGQTSSGTTTDSQGHFTLNDLPMGKHSLRVKTQEGGPSHFEPLDLFEGTSFVTVHLPGSAVEGKVVDQEGNPIIGASLSLRRLKEGDEEDPWGEEDLGFALDLFGGSSTDGARTDSDGHYMIDGIPEKQRLGIEARAAGYVRAVSASFEVNAESSFKAETIRLHQAGSVRATVDGGLSMFRSCRAERQGEGVGPDSARTISQDGFALFKDLGPGEWKITTRGEGGASLHATVTVIGGQQTEALLQP